ncbi:MAG: polysaccharide biosynthesis tyrosine autokinase [Tannerellaceae bacterium]|jgi:capsular exopolysaccharide synthesis family protein|nr:polysaccharide biosynthesis tyrosine autokinase [Tannerellaceae bacterium]
MEQDTLDVFKEKESEIELSDILHILRMKWYWLVLSVAMCCSVGALYLLWAPKVYTRTASVLIKDDSKGGGAMSESAAFEDLGLFNVKRNVDNEMLIFQSEQHMTTVAERLHLDISYTIKEGLRTTELYTHSPVNLQFPDAEKMQEFSLVATPLSEDQVLLSGFLDDASEEVIATLNDTVATSLGRVLVTSTLYYTDAFYHVPVTVTKGNMTKVIKRYVRELQIALASKTATIINLTLQDVSISRAEDVLNTLIAVYNEEAISDKNQIMVNTSNFIKERLLIIEKDLGSVDTDIEVYKRENRLTDIQSETGMYLRESSRYSEDELALENQKQLADYIRTYLTDPSRSADLIPSNTGISDVNIEGRIGEYNSNLLKRNRLISNSSNRNPVVMDLNNSLSAMRQSIIRAVDNLIVGLDVQLRNMKERDKQNMRRISDVPTQQKNVLSIERQQKIKESLYLYLLNKREENALSQSLTESNARIIDPATGSDLPVAPKTAIIMLAAFVLGVVFFAGGVWLCNALNTTVRNRKDIEAVLTAPFLGDIPLHKHKKGDNNRLLVHEFSRDTVSEAFRVVRTNMSFMQTKAGGGQVVMFVSLREGAGKTFVSLNLAMSLALTNKKVIMLDLDIRKGTLSSIVQKDQDVPGITHFLSGIEDNIGAIVSEGEVMDVLDVIHAGPIPPNPSELLLSDRLDALIKVLRREYDYIFIDCVPVDIVADASIVSRVADLTIYVIRAGLLDRRQLPDIERLYRQKKFNNLSILLNAVDYKSDGYYNGYQYGYGYRH